MIIDGTRDYNTHTIMMVSREPSTKYEVCAWLRRNYNIDPIYDYNLTRCPATVFRGMLNPEIWTYYTIPRK